MFVEVTPIAIKNIYWRYYAILAGLNGFNAIMLWLFYPETARKSLEELDFFFVKKYGSGGAADPLEKGTGTKGDAEVELEERKEGDDLA
jgi:hypothetical protein